METKKEENQPPDIDKKTVENLQPLTDTPREEEASEQDAPNGFQHFIDVKGDFKKAIGCGG